MTSGADNICFNDVVGGKNNKWGWTEPTPGIAFTGAAIGPYNFDIWFSAGGCDTSVGVKAGTGTVSVNSAGDVTITYSIAGNYQFDTVYAEVNQNQLAATEPGQMQYPISATPTTLTGAVQLGWGHFYFYMHFHLTGVC
jgi:hypothetical protein